MADIKVVHSTDLGAGLEITAGKVVIGAAMATDMEVAASIAASDASDATRLASAITADNAVEASENATRDYITRAQAVIHTSCAWEMRGNKVRMVAEGVSGVRMIIMGAGENGVVASSTGYASILPPAPGTVVKGLGISDVVVAADGYIQLQDWSNLYYSPVPGADHSTVGTWYISAHGQGDYVVPTNAVLIGSLTHDFTTVFTLADGMKVYEGINYPDTSWRSLSPYYAAGVSDLGGGYQAPRFRRAGNMLQIEGMCEAVATGFAGTSVVILATLPVGFRPKARHMMASSAHDVARRVDITAAGEIIHIISTDGHTWVSLEFSISLS